jgi:uncharacterized protein
MNRVEASKIIDSSAPSLRMQLYVVTSIATNLEAVKQVLPEHRVYLKELEERDVLFGAGPLWTDDGEFFEGDGMLIYRAASVAAATAITSGRLRQRRSRSDAQKRCPHFQNSSLAPE